jgi:hypothetical protein
MSYMLRVMPCLPQDESVIARASEELKEEYGRLVDLQHELAEHVKFTKVRT